VAFPGVAALGVAAERADGTGPDLELDLLGDGQRGAAHRRSDGSSAAFLGSLDGWSTCPDAA
jgi:hypothetical protein